MRDMTLIQEFQKLSKRTVMLYDQLEEIHLRQEATERVVLYSPWYLRIKYLFKPSAFFQNVDAVQLKMHDRARAQRVEEMAEAEAKNKIKVVPANTSILASK